VRGRARWGRGWQVPDAGWGDTRARLDLRGAEYLAVLSRWGAWRVLAAGGGDLLPALRSADGAVATVIAMPAGEDCCSAALRLLTDLEPAVPARRRQSSERWSITLWRTAVLGEVR
jgi:hypothetical protein